MGRKPKFRPEVTWIKLNPEQAVLSCNCYTIGLVASQDQSGHGGETVGPPFDFACGGKGKAFGTGYDVIGGSNMEWAVPQVTPMWYEQAQAYS